MNTLSDRAPRGLRAIPSGIWALGFVSLFMDVSSELIHSLLPVFLVSVLGASALSVGLIEGIAEATAALIKLVSGRLSDHIGRRKPLALVGYGLATMAKPLFPLADSVALVFTARFVDRLGKGIRVAWSVLDRAGDDVRMAVQASYRLQLKWLVNVASRYGRQSRRRVARGLDQGRLADRTPARR